MTIRDVLSGHLDERFVQFFVAANWALLGLMVAAATFLWSGKMGAGVLVGGVIANLNCLGLDRDCKRMIRWRNIAAYFGGLAVRMGLITLAVTAAFLFLGHLLSPVGVFVGLSVALVNFYILVLAMIVTRVRYKEAV